MGAGMGAETTAAATGKVGVVRRDPMAMLPFCAYDMAEYFSHWLTMGRALKHPPAIFRVNWFRKGENGKFIWPGFGENVRVLKWILERLQGKTGARETFIGHLPEDGSIDIHGLSVSRDQMRALTALDREGWRGEAEEMSAFFRKFGDKLPPAIRDEHARLARSLNSTTQYQS